MIRNPLRNVARRMMATATSAAEQSRLSPSNLNPAVVNAAYAVRGSVLQAATNIQTRMKAGEKFGFDSLTLCNIGNPQSLKQKPLSFVRQVLSIVLNPSLLDLPAGTFPADVVTRARKYLSSMPSAGAYSDSQGVAAVREEVARFVGERDGTDAADPSKIFLTNGASEAVRFMMSLMIRPGQQDGMLVPIPQYPLYSALSTLLSGELCPYYLNEGKGWALTPEALQQALDDARAQGTCVRGLVVINPGNPTGQILTKDNMQAIVELCVREGLVLMADEVYQENAYAPGKPFASFRKVAQEMGYKDSDASSPLQMVSFHSTSKGFLGECGLRGGYMQVQGLHPDVLAQVYKQASISLCSNTIGQLCTGLMVQPPREGEASHHTYVEER